MCSETLQVVTAQAGEPAPAAGDGEVGAGTLVAASSASADALTRATTDRCAHCFGCLQQASSPPAPCPALYFFADGREGMLERRNTPSAHSAQSHMMASCYRHRTNPTQTL